MSNQEGSTMTTTKTLDQRIRAKAVKTRETEVLSVLRKIISEACGSGRVLLTLSEHSPERAISPERGWLITQLMEHWRANNTVEIGDKAVALFLRDHEAMAKQIQDLQMSGE